MIKKAIIQGTVTILIFLASWFAISQISWLKLLKAVDSDKQTEQTSVVAQDHSILQR